MQSVHLGARGPVALTGIPTLALSVAIVLLCLYPAFASPRARLTSDESLYASEGLNLSSGRGLTYTTGAPVTHRPPLYPALLAATFEVAGPSLDAATWVGRVATAVNALLVLLLARRLGGPLAGFVAAAVVASSAYLNGLAATLFVDPVECTFILASVYLLVHARVPRSSWTSFAAGCALGLAVLTKESALQLAPLPLLVVLLAGVGRGWHRGLLLWFAGLGLVISPWWAWVFVNTGAIYLLGDLSSGTVRALAAAIAGAAMVSAVTIWVYRDRIGPGPRARYQILAGILALAWGGLFLLGLEWQSWDHPARYLTDVPAYFVRIAAPAYPATPLMLGAVAWAAVRAARGDHNAAIVSGVALLFLPFVLFAANRELSLRDMLPFLYAGAIALGFAAAWLIDRGAALAGSQDTPAPAWAGLAVTGIALAAVVWPGLGHVAGARSESLDSDWDNQVAADTAAWIELNLTPGEPVMSTRLYYSHVYFLTAGDSPIHQVPTVLVEPGDAGLDVRSTLFRWEALPARDRSEWLYLARYGRKGYYIGLAEEDLLAGLREGQVRYFVLNSVDAGFSSPAFAAYFDAHPAFEKVYERSYSDLDSTLIYRVDAGLLQPIESKLRVTSYAYESLLEQADGDSQGLAAWLTLLNANGFEVVPY